MNIPVENMAKNQLIIETRNGQYFQSYNSFIAFRPFNPFKPIQLDINKWDFSRTTGKYRNAFLCETISETIKKIASGEYALTELN